MQPTAAYNLLTDAELTQQYAPDADWSAVTVSGVIHRATREMQKFCKVDGFVAQTVTDETQPAIINTAGELILNPRVRPLQTLTAIALIRGSILISLVPGDGGSNYYHIDPDTGNVKFVGVNLTLPYSPKAGLYQYRNNGYYAKFSYTGGWDPLNIPEDLKEACALWCRGVYQYRKANPVGANQFSQGSFSVNFGAAGADNELIASAKKMLIDGGYVRVVL